jgi:hypothetical protein
MAENSRIKEHLEESLEINKKQVSNFLENLDKNLGAETESLKNSKNMQNEEETILNSTPNPTENLTTPVINRLKSNSEKTGDNVRHSIFTANQNSDERAFSKISPNFKSSHEIHFITQSLQTDNSDKKNDFLGKREELSHLEIMAQPDSEFDHQLKKIKPSKFLKTFSNFLNFIHHSFS